MERTGILLATGLLAVSLASCSKSATDQPASKSAARATEQQSQPGPDRVVYEFLEAVRVGDDDAAAAMLTTLARKRTSEYGMVVAPPGSDTASFKVGKVTFSEKDRARVQSTWTDINAQGSPHTDRIEWLLKREKAGWRIWGLVTRVYEDLDPIELNFEKPEEMERKQAEAERELARREAERTRGAAKASGGAARSRGGGNSTRR